jgi:hypothetical protein
MNTRFLFLFLMMLLTPSAWLLSQEVTFHLSRFSYLGDLERKTILLSEPLPELSSSDSTFAPRKPKLLPERISLIERAFWGESGLWRATNLAPLDIPTRKAELEVRRVMLTAHQLSGWATLSLMLTTLYMGQRYVDGNYSDFNLYNQKRAFGKATVVAYFTTASFALFSPPPIVRRDEWSGISTHKFFAWIHFAGMIITPIIASMAASGSGGDAYRERIRLHQISAYITTVAFGAAIVSLAF